MNFFKKYNTFITLFTSILMLVLGGCSATVDSDKQGNNDEANNLSIESFTLESKQKIYHDMDSPLLVTDKSFVLRVCIVESLLLKSLHGKTFTLSGDNTDHTLIADARGCVRFTQKIHMGNETAGKHYQTFNRTLKTHDNYYNTLTLRYAINPWDETFIDLKTSENFNEELITGQKNINQNIFVIDSISGSFAGIISKRDSTASKVKFLANLTTCINLPIQNGVSLKNQNFKVELTNIESGETTQQILETNQSGCLKFSYESHYDPNSNQRWIPYDLTIHAIGGALTGNKQHRTFYLFPWSGGSLFFWDSEVGTPPDTQINEMAKLYVPNFNFTYTGNGPEDFHLTKSLGLSLVKNYQLELNPMRADAHNFIGDLPYQSISSGEFEIRVVVLTPLDGDLFLTKENESRFMPIMSAKTLARAINGKITANLKFRILFNDTPKLQMRAISVIEIRPLGDSTSLKPLVVMGQFFGDTPQFRSNIDTQNGADSLKEIDENYPMTMGFLSNIEEQNRAKLQDPWQLSILETFKLIHSDAKSLEDVQTIFLDQLKTLQDISLNQSEFTLLYQYTGHKPLIQKFCKMVLPYREIRSLWGTSKIAHPNFSECLKTPSKFLDITAHKVIDEIIEHPHRLSSYTDSISVGVGFFMFNSESARKGRMEGNTYDVGLSGKIEVPFVNFMSLGGGAKYQISHITSNDKINGATSRGAFSRNRNLQADILTLGFKARIRKCLYIKATPEAQNKARIHLCDNTLLNQSLQESWYYISEGNARMSSLRDRWSSEENTLTKLIRGDLEFNRFYNLMTDQTKAVFLERIKNVNDPEVYFQHFYQRADKSDRPSLKDSALPGILELPN